VTLGARVFGIIRRPRATFEAVAAAPKWLGLMATMVAASTLSGALLFQSEIGRLALVDQWERTAIAFGQQVDDDRYNELQTLSDQWPVYSAARALLNGPVLVLGVAGFLFVVARNGSHRASFRQILAVVTHASVILTIRQIVAAPVAYARETTSSATSLAVWFPAFGDASSISRFLGALDLFVVWWLVLLAIGASVLYRRSARPLALSFVGVYMGVAIVMAIAMVLLGGSA
jgi:Yip1-like protein